MTASAQCIIDACVQSWDEELIDHTPNRNNCSGFVRSVAGHLGIQLPASTADGIINSISRSWKTLGSGAEAAQQAAAGFLVIAGLKGADHDPARTNGHVAIVVPGALYRGIYPRCWGGSLGGAQSRGNKSTGEVWNSRDRDQVEYYMHAVMPVCAAA